MTKAEAEFYAEAMGSVADGFLMAGIIGLALAIACVGGPFIYALWKAWKERQCDKNP